MATWDFYSSDGYVKVGVTDASGLSPADFILKAGDSGIGTQSFSGDIILTNDPTAGTHATRQSYTEGRYLVKATGESDTILSDVLIDAASGGSLLRNSTGDTPIAGELVWKEWVDNTFLPFIGGTLTGDLTLNDASLYMPVDTLSSGSLNLDSTHRVLLADTTSSGMLFNLPASPTAGQWYEFKDVGNSGVGNASNFSITIGANGNNINGVASDIILTNDGSSLVVVSDGTDWFTVDGVGNSVVTFEGLSDTNISGGQVDGDFLVYDTGEVVDTNLINLTSTGIFDIATTGVSGGLRIGGDAQIYRSGTQELSVDSKLKTLAAVSQRVTTTSGPTYNVDLNADHVILVDTSSNAVTVTLPTPPANGDTVVVKDQTGDSITNPITVDTAGAELIDADTDIEIATPYAAVTLQFYGSNWYRL